jgi:hypothetical protein
MRGGRVVTGNEYVESGNAQDDLQGLAMRRSIAVETFVQEMVKIGSEHAAVVQAMRDCNEAVAAAEATVELKIACKVAADRIADRLWHQCVVLWGERKDMNHAIMAKAIKEAGG